MNQQNQTTQNLNQQPNKGSAVKGKEAFDKDQQGQKYNAANAKDKASETYSPNKKKVEEDEIDSDSISE